MASANQDGTVEQRLEALDRKVDDGFTQAYVQMAQGFAEHRVLVLDTFGKFRSEVDQRFEQVDERFEKVDRRLVAVDVRLDKVAQRLDRVDKRLEGVDRRLDTLDRRMDSLDNRLERHALRTTARFDRLEGKLDGFIGAQARVNREVLDKLDRLTTLITSPPSPPPPQPPPG